MIFSQLKQKKISTHTGFAFPLLPISKQLSTVIINITYIQMVIFTYDWELPEILLPFSLPYYGDFTS